MEWLTVRVDANTAWFALVLARACFAATSRCPGPSAGPGLYGLGGKEKCCAGSASTVFSGSEFSCECGRRVFFDATQIPLLVLFTRNQKSYLGIDTPMCCRVQCPLSLCAVVCFELLCIGTFLSVVFSSVSCLPLAGYVFC